MSKQFIQFAGVLFMLAAIFAVSAQENTTALNNATMNNTTLLNNTTLNASVIAAPILPTETANETVQRCKMRLHRKVIPQNVTVPENATVATQPLSTAAVSQPEVTQVGSPQKTVFAVGGGESTPSPSQSAAKLCPRGLTKSACLPRQLWT